MNVEENRLRTFSDWPANAAIDAARVAKAGFYYTGQGVEAQCFLCGTKISDWNYGDQAMARHRQADPNCPFVLNPSSTCNIPLMPVTASDNVGTAASSAEAQLSDSLSEIRSITPFFQSRDPPKEYRSYAQRLKSFANWPIPHVVSPEKLARAGFYYLQHINVVECAYCRGVILKWEPGDDPDKEHRIHFPKCDFYMHQTEEDKLDLCNVKLMPGTTGDLAELGIQAHPAPSKPKLATYEGRLQTFYGWPENLKQTPEMLSSAGFYYYGSEDHVKCFHCGGGLRNWEATDDVWTEHARWFPKCGYVNLVKGQEFIKQCIDNRPPLDQSIFSGVAEEESRDVAETPPASLSTVVPPSQEITDAVLERLLHTPPAMAALEVGLHVGRVKRALKRRMEQVGVPYTNPDQLIEDVLHEQVMEGDASQSPESPSLEMINFLHNVIFGSTNNATRQSSDTEGNAPCPENNDDNKPEICTNNVEKPAASEKESSAVEKKSSGKSEETVSLEEENRRLKEARLCKICMDREVAVVFLPCGHLATCVHCAPSLTYCPMCRQAIRATVRTFLS